MSRDVSGTEKFLAAQIVFAWEIIKSKSISMSLLKNILNKRWLTIPIGEFLLSLSFLPPPFLLDQAQLLATIPTIATAVSSAALVHPIVPAATITPSPLPPLLLLLLSPAPSIYYQAHCGFFPLTILPAQSGPSFLTGSGEQQRLQHSPCDCLVTGWDERTPAPNSWGTTGATSLPLVYSRESFSAAVLTTIFSLGGVKLPPHSKKNSIFLQSGRVTQVCRNICPPS